MKVCRSFFSLNRSFMGRRQSVSTWLKMVRSWLKLATRAATRSMGARDARVEPTLKPLRAEIARCVVRLGRETGGNRSSFLACSATGA